MKLLQKIESMEVKVAVVGLGYVGLPLAVEFAKAGFSVLGVDNTKDRMEKAKKGISYIEDVPSNVLTKLVKQGKFTATDDFEELKKIDVIIICVPTPMRKTKEPNISFVIAATKQIEKYLEGQKLVILESTTYPGTSEELILPILSKNGKKVGRDFFLAYSPERVDPGNKQYGTADIAKVVGGITPECLSLINSLYNHVFAKVVPVSSTKVAETIKLLENTFRTVNIALVDEVALMCNKMGIDVWEVIRGASSKPFGYMPFYPGPGVGGACLPKDPIYLAWKAKLYNFRSRFVELASDITTSMPKHVVERVKDLLKSRKKKLLKGSKVLILGIAYKNDLGDTRDAPAFDVIKLLQKGGAEVIYNDPHVAEISVGNKKYKSVELNNKALKDADIVVIITAHSKYDLGNIVEHATLLFDTRGATWDIAKERTNVVRL